MEETVVDCPKEGKGAFSVDADCGNSVEGDLKLSRFVEDTEKTDDTGDFGCHGYVYGLFKSFHIVGGSSTATVPVKIYLSII